MAAARCLLFAATLAVAASAAWAQPFEFKRVWNPSQQEAAQREADNYTGLVFNFETAKKTDGGTPNGSLKSDQVSQNPFLSTLPGDGNGQTLVTLGPCAGNTVHSHPRGSEISFVTAGQMLFGLVEENTPAGPNKPVLRNIQVGETIHVPQGLLHFSHNPTCEPAQFLANFATSDPGTQSTWTSLIAVPDAVLQLSTGIPEATFQRLRAQYPLVIAPGTGGEACLARCGLNFTQSNAFFPAEALPSIGAYGAPPAGASAAVPPGYGIDFLPGGKYSTPGAPMPVYGAAPITGAYPTPGSPGSPGNPAVVSPLPGVPPPLPRTPPPTAAPTPLTPLSGPTLAPAKAATPAPTAAAAAAAGPTPGTSTSASGNAASQASNGNSVSSSTGAPSAGGSSLAGALQNPFSLLQG